MTGLEFLILAAIAGWISAAPDKATLAARGGTAGAVRAAATTARDRARTERAALPTRTRTLTRPQAQGRTQGRTPAGATARTPWWTALRNTRTVRAGLAIAQGTTRAGLATWRGARTGARVAVAAGRVAAAGARAVPTGYRAGAVRAVERRQARQARRTRTTATTDPAGTDPNSDTGQVDGQVDQAVTPEPAPEGVPALEEVPGDQGQATGPAVDPVVEQGDGRFDVALTDVTVTDPVTDPRTGAPLAVRTGPPSNGYEAMLSPVELARLRRLEAIRGSGYAGWLDQDLRSVPEPGLPSRNTPPADVMGAATTDLGDASDRSDRVDPGLMYFDELYRQQPPAGGWGTTVPVEAVRPCERPGCGGLYRPVRGTASFHADGSAAVDLRCDQACGTTSVHSFDWDAPDHHEDLDQDPSDDVDDVFGVLYGAAGREGLTGHWDHPDDPQEPADPDEPLDVNRASLPDAGPASAGPVPSTTPSNNPSTTDTKEHVMAEIAEFETTADLRAEAEELEVMAEEIHAARAEFERRAKGLEEKVGGAPFGTKAIAEAVTAVGEAPTTDDAAEALTELRRALDESDALADVADSLQASGDVKAYAAA